MIIYSVKRSDSVYANEQHQSFFLHRESAEDECNNLNSYYDQDMYEVVEVYVEE